MDQKQPNRQQDHENKDAQKSGQPVQLDKDKQDKQGQQQGGQQQGGQHQGGQQMPSREQQQGAEKR